MPPLRRDEPKRRPNALVLALCGAALLAAALIGASLASGSGDEPSAPATGVAPVAPDALLRGGRALRSRRSGSTRSTSAPTAPP